MKRIYGQGKTHLRLTGKAADGYYATDPLTIIENETQEENPETGEDEYTYTYSIRESCWGGVRKEMTEPELIEFLEGLAFDGEEETCVDYIVSFEAGTGVHFNGGVNFMHSEDGWLYAETPVPDGASEDYGYIALRDAILKLAAVHGVKQEEIEFPYDNQEEYLEQDANAECDVYAEWRGDDDA